MFRASELRNITTKLGTAPPPLLHPSALDQPFGAPQGLREELPQPQRAREGQPCAKNLEELLGSGTPVG